MRGAALRELTIVFRLQEGRRLERTSRSQEPAQKCGVPGQKVRSAARQRPEQAEQTPGGRIKLPERKAGHVKGE